jgi:hypothetical protein
MTEVMAMTVARNDSFIVYDGKWVFSKGRERQKRTTVESMIMSLGCSSSPASRKRESWIIYASVEPAAPFLNSNDTG